MFHNLVHIETNIGDSVDISARIDDLLLETLKILLKKYLKMRPNNLMISKTLLKLYMTLLIMIKILLKMKVHH